MQPDLRPGRRRPCLEDVTFVRLYCRVCGGEGLMPVYRDQMFHLRRAVAECPECEARLMVLHVPPE